MAGAARNLYTLTGDKEVDRKLAAMTAKLRNRAVKPALEKAARVLLKATRANLQAIRVTGRHTDKISRSLAVKRLPKERRRRGVMARIVEPGSRQELGISQGDRWFYPAHIELGSKNAPPRPYMRQAVKTERGAVVAVFRGEVKRFVQAQK